jgi:endonuclease YncB( thermonuclease family)
MIRFPSRLAVSLSLALLTVSLALAADQFSGKVVAITDGDTIKVMHQGQAVKVRLYGVDSPEKRQPFGKRAKQFTASLAFEKMVTVEVKGRDTYDRIIGEVILPDGHNLNHELVRAGFAWWYERYAPNDNTLSELESKASEAMEGLWADSNPIAPWEWRKQSRDRR